MLGKFCTEAFDVIKYSVLGALAIQVLENGFIGNRIRFESRGDILNTRLHESGIIGAGTSYRCGL